MFSDLDYLQKEMVYESLVRMVKTNSGIGFTNADQGHPAYAVGRRGEVNYATWGDEPERNRLFRMMKALAQELVQNEKSPPIDPVLTWADFCQLGHEASMKYPITKYPCRGFEDVGPMFGEVK